MPAPTPSPHPAPTATQLRPTALEVQAAAARLSPWLPPTPVLTSRSLDRLAGRRLFFKCEPFQRGGSFKIRGALNAVLALDEATARRGVLTHSSGNFGQALAIAASIRQIPVWVVMPDDAPAVKVAAVQEYGATVSRYPRDDRAETAATLATQTGATYISSYDHVDVIAAQASCGLELLRQVPDLDAIIAPIGGGGLVGGLALACHYQVPSVRVYAAEPLGADDAARSKAAGHRLPQTDPRTIADGLRTSVGVHTWPILRDVVTAVLTVTEDEIIASMRHIWQRLKVVTEPSGAVALAAALRHDLPDAERIGIVLSGGNVDLGQLPF